MIPELGHFALITALSLALLQGTVPLIGAWRGNEAWMAVASPAARAQFLFLLISFASLTWSFVVSDFSVAYVATNSNSLLPVVYRVSAVWGAHEGSLLLWALILSGWAFAVSVRSGALDAQMRARVLAVMGLVSVGFLLFMLMTSNPFDRLVPAALEGRDLNPLLQDPGLALHPPMLYMGYVGLSVPFAFAIAALLGGQLDAAWTRWSRPWTTVAWTFLTMGIALGSWWAYYELGWGGWWFWDPVENASFMPWLVATALIHSLAVTEKRGAFRAWTVLLAIFGFSLSLLGTFLVRSGVLVSVHAFATDPARGLFILIFLALVVGGALTLFAWRGARVSAGGSFSIVSRETLLLVNNVLLVVASASVLLGTLYPLLMDALGLGKISVGPPYFAAVFVPLMLPLLLLMALGPLARWKRDSLSRLMRGRTVALAVSMVVGIAATLALTPSVSPYTMVALGMAVWVLWGTFLAIRERLAKKQDAIAGIRRLPRAFVGMCLAHVGIAVFVLGVTFVSTNGLERDLALSNGQEAEVAGYRVRFEGVVEVAGPNYTAQRGILRVFEGDRVVAVLQPEKRTYTAQSQQMTEADIDSGVLRDVYVALGEPLGDGAWAVRVYYKPLVNWIWFGPLMMAIGGLLAASDRRYRRTVRGQQPAKGEPEPSAIPEVRRA